MEFVTKALEGLGILGLVVATTLLLGWAFIKPYLEQWAKQFATREQFAELLQQQREMTRATEGIRTDLGGSLWRDQQLWSKRLETLVDLADYLGRLEDILTRGRLHRDDVAARKAALAAAFSREKELHGRTVDRAEILGRMILRPSAMQRFDEAKRVLTRFLYDESAWPKDKDFEAETRYFAQISFFWTHDFLQAAQDDVGALRSGEVAELEVRDKEAQRLRDAMKVLHQKDAEPAALARAVNEVRELNGAPALTEARAIEVARELEETRALANKTV